MSTITRVTIPGRAAGTRPDELDGGRGLVHGRAAVRNQGWGGNHRGPDRLPCGRHRGGASASGQHGGRDVIHGTPDPSHGEHLLAITTRMATSSSCTQSVWHGTGYTRSRHVPRWRWKAGTRWSDERSIWKDIVMDTAAVQANIGVVGLAVMGATWPATWPAARATRWRSTTARRSARDTLIAEHPEAGFVASKSIEDFVASLATAAHRDHHGAGRRGHRRRHRRSSPSGSSRATSSSTAATPTSTTRSAASKRPAAQRPRLRRHRASPAARRARCNGPSIMPGGSAEAYETLGPILASIAAVAEGEPCVTHVGTDGAGHFVKMIHNGIEYADMQLIAEAYDLLRRVGGPRAAEIADVFEAWNKGDLESYLIEITAEVLRQVDAETGRPLVDVIVDEAGSKGTGVWTVQNARRPRRAGRRASPRRCSPAPCRASPSSARPSGARSRERPAGAGRRRRVRGRRARRAVRLEGRRLRAGLRRDHRRSRRSTAGTSTRARSPRSGAAAASSGPSSSTASSTRTANDPDLATLLQDALLRRRRSPTARPRGAASSSTAVLSGVPVPGFALGAQLLRLAGVRAPAGRADPGPARLLRCAHLPAHRRARACSTRSGRATGPRSMGGQFALDGHAVQSARPRPRRHCPCRTNRTSQQRRLSECDMIMKGGITSGVVYPWRPCICRSVPVPQPRRRIRWSHCGSDRRCGRARSRVPAGSTG